MMVKTTTLIPDETAHGDDSKVVAAIEATFKSALGETNSSYMAGIRNESGDIYREVTFDSFDQLPSLSNRLRRLGFTEEMDEEGGMIDGYDATFRPK